MEKQKLLKNLNSKGRYLTLLLTVTAGLLYCSSAWAGYYVTGNAASGWGTWSEMTKESDNRYTLSLSAGEEFKVSNNQQYNDDWYKKLTITDGVGATLARLSSDMNSNMKITLNDGYSNPVLCYDPKDNGYVWVEASQPKKVGFFDEKDAGYVWQIQFGYNNANWKQHGDRAYNYSGDKDLGILTTSLYIDADNNSYAWTFGPANKQVVLYSRYKVNDGTFSSFKNELSQNWSDEGNQQVKFQSSQKIFDSDVTPGNYVYEYYLHVTALDAECDRCDCNNGSSAGSNMKITFTYPGWSTTSGSATIGSSPVGIPVTKSNISLGTHYGDSDGVTTAISGTNKSDFSVTSVAADKITVKFTPSAVGERTATITITDKYGKTRTLTVTGTGNNTPTVLIAGKETVLDTEVTLNGYIKYTGCQNVTEYGFVYGTGETPTTSDNKEVAGTTGAEAGYPYSTSFDVMDNGTYNYRAYMIAGGTPYYSTEVRQFTIESTCPYYPDPKPVLTLNGYVDNVICLDESVVAKCVSKPGFKYTLFGPDSNPIGVEEREGDGSTLVWQRDNALKAAGTYIIKTKKEGTDCWATSAKATQTINSATMTIEAENGNPYIYEPVTIIKSENQDEFTKPTWSIVTAESGAYLLNFENKLIYSNKEVDKVLFKGGSAKDVQVTANAYKTVVFEGGNKTCPAVVTPVTIIVKADDEVCGK